MNDDMETENKSSWRVELHLGVNGNDLWVYKNIALTVW